MIIFLSKIMPIFSLGERVRILETEKEPKTYVIKKMKKIRKGGILYLLESIEDSALRLHYEDKNFLLERVS